MKPLRRLLRPLVRLLIQSGITFPVFAELARTLYVEVAAHDMLREPTARTDSRISLLTGVHRKEIRRLRGLAGEALEPPVVTLGSQIVGRWLGTPLYADRRGRPLPLPRTAPSGPSFEALVTSVTTDIRPRAVLDELLRQGTVSLDSEDRVRLATNAFVPRPGRDEQLFYFGRNLHDHIAAASANVTSAGDAPFLDRSVHYDRLSTDTAAHLQHAGEDMAQRLLVDFNRLALAVVDADDQQAGNIPQTTHRRVNLGIYLYIDDDPPGGTA